MALIMMHATRHVCDIRAKKNATLPFACDKQTKSAKYFVSRDGMEAKVIESKRFIYAHLILMFF